jgi:hypothetical protein
MIGSTGKVHGVVIVKMPASRAKKVGYHRITTVNAGRPGAAMSRDLISISGGVVARLRHGIHLCVSWSGGRDRRAAK